MKHLLILLERCAIKSHILNYWGYVVVQFVEALRYKPEGHGFDS